MRVHVVSDVHGRADALAGAGGADALICLGDLLLFIDYADHGQGIFADLFGAEAGPPRSSSCATAKRFDDARRMSRAAVGPAGRRPVRARGEGRRRPVRGAVRGHARARLPDLRQRGPARGCGRRTCGPATTSWTGSGPCWAAGRSASSAAGCTRPTARPTRSTRTRSRPRWPPPARWTCCAATSRRTSRSCCTTPWPGGSSGAARRCSGTSRQTQPRYALFGHVHQPLARRVRIGRTECINVGSFPRHRHPVRPGVVAAAWRAAARPGVPGPAVRGTLRAWATGRRRASPSARTGSGVMAVIADFAAYPQWASAVRSAEVVSRGRRRAAQPGPVQPGCRDDQGQLRARLPLGRRLRGALGPGRARLGHQRDERELRSGQAARRHRGDLRAQRGRPGAAARHAEAPGGEGHHRHRAEGAQGPGRGPAPAADTAGRKEEGST